MVCIARLLPLLSRFGVIVFLDFILLEGGLVPIVVLARGHGAKA